MRSLPLGKTITFRIDIFTKYFFEAVVKNSSPFGVSVYAFNLLLLIAWHSARFVYSEYEYGTIAFAAVPAWLSASIIPLSFFLIAVRYGLLFLSGGYKEKNTESNNDNNTSGMSE